MLDTTTRPERGIYAHKCRAPAAPSAMAPLSARCYFLLVKADAGLRGCCRVGRQNCGGTSKKLFSLHEKPHGLRSFIDQLLTEGVARVTPEGELPAADEATESLLTVWEQTARAELCGQPPAFVPAAALWAAEIFYHACRCVSCRDIDEAQMGRALQKPCPVPRGPGVDWSVDLIFRQLPPLCRLTKQLSNGDPLVQLLQQLARRWPLSSVGVALAETPELQSFIEEPSLKGLYVDRILETGDVSRLGDPRVDDSLRMALGAHPELCPVIARKLFPAGLDPLSQSDEVAPD